MKAHVSPNGSVSLWSGALPSSFDGWFVGVADDPLPTIADQQVIEPGELAIDYADGVPVQVRRTWTVRAKTRDERVPASVPFGAFRAALELSGIAPATVEALLDAIPDPQIKIVAKNKFAHATVAERDDPLLRQMGAAMGLSDAQIDDIFVLAPTVW